MRYPYLSFLVFLLAFLSSCSKANNNAGTVKDAATEGADRCTDFDGKTYAAGETFPRDCATCRCTDVGGKLGVSCTLSICRDTNPPDLSRGGQDGSTSDVVIDAPNLGRDGATIDAPESRGEAGTNDAAVDAQARLDVPPTCPAGPPSSGSGPCPAGAVCQYSFALQCEPGCSGGTFLEYDCYNNLWRQIRATSGAPVCRCPPGLDAKADGPG